MTSGRPKEQPKNGLLIRDNDLVSLKAASRLIEGAIKGIKGKKISNESWLHFIRLDLS